MRSFIALLLAFIATTATSQNPISFADPDARWYVARTYINPTPDYPDFVETKTSLYGFDGDTLISGQTWLKFYKSTDPGFTETEFAGAIREENHTVLFLDPDGTKDTLYRFDLAEGDSVYYDLEWDYWPDYLKIEKIDTLEISGVSHRRFIFEKLDDLSASLHEQWIEGIGSIHGPLFPAYPRDFAGGKPDSTKVTCYYRGEDLIWSNPYYDECYISIVLSAHHPTDESLSLFPNPAGDHLSIQFPPDAGEPVQVRIYDLQGRLILKESFEAEPVITLSTASWNNGLYILEVELGEKIYRQKVMKR